MEKFAIFDMDGTLTDSMGIWKNSQQKLLDRYHAVKKMEIGEQLNTTTPEEGAALLCQAYGLPITPDQMQREIKEIVAEGYTQAELKPGVRHVLEEMRAKGVKMCILSSTSQDLMMPMLHRLELEQYFEFTDSCHSGRNKSTPAPYLDAMAKLGASDPGQVLVFEDAWHGVNSAKQGGFKVVAIEDEYAADRKADILATADIYLTSWENYEVL